MAINKLNSGTIKTNDQVPFSSFDNGQDRKASVAELLALVTQAAVQPFPTQYAAPNATGFTVAVTALGVSAYLLLTPLAGYAAGTITLPAVATCVDGQEFLVSCTQSVATLTVGGNGATVNGAPTALAANGFFRLRFDAVNDSWYRIG